MTQDKKRKRRVRARMAKTGETYQAASHALAAEPAAPAAPDEPAQAPPRLRYELHYLAHVLKIGETPFTVGRNPSCDLQLDDALVSRVHASFGIAEDGALLLADHESRNGVFVNHVRVNRHAVVVHGDVVAVGSAKLTVRAIDEHGVPLPHPRPHPPAPRDADVVALPRPLALPRTILDADPSVGSVIAGRYRLTALLSPPATPLAGAGTSPSPYRVYEAQHVLLGGPCRIKLLPNGQPSHLRAWLLREGRALQKASHADVQRVYDIGETDAGEVYLVLEPVPATTIGTWVLAKEIDVRRTRAIVLAIARVLEHVHARGVIHRGLSNDAVHVEERGAEIAVKLTSFELADIAGEPRLAPIGAPIGRGSWMSPEQQRGEADARSDLYGLGAILHTMLWGELPPEVRGADLLAPPRRSGLEAICTKLLAASPADRFQTAAEVAAAVERVGDVVLH